MRTRPAQGQVELSCSRKRSVLFASLTLCCVPEDNSLKSSSSAPELQIWGQELRNSVIFLFYVKYNNRINQSGTNQYSMRHECKSKTEIILERIFSELSNSRSMAYFHIIIVTNSMEYYNGIRIWPAILNQRPRPAITSLSKTPLKSTEDSHYPPLTEPRGKNDSSKNLKCTHHEYITMSSPS